MRASPASPPGRASATSGPRRWPAGPSGACARAMSCRSSWIGCGSRAAWTSSARRAGRSASRRARGSSPCAARGPTWRPIRGSRTTRGSGPRCSTRGVGPGAAASTTWTRSWPRSGLGHRDDEADRREHVADPDALGLGPDLHHRLAGVVHLPRELPAALLRAGDRLHQLRHHFLEGVTVAVVKHGHPGRRDLDVGRVELVDLRGLGWSGLQPDAVVLQPGLHYLSARLAFGFTSPCYCTARGHGLADSSRVAEAGDGAVAVAQDFAEDLVGVLAELRGPRGPADLALGADGAAHLLQGPEVRVLHLHDHIARGHLRIGQGLAHVVDRRARHAAAETFEPLLGGAGGEAGL